MLCVALLYLLVGSQLPDTVDLPDFDQQACMNDRLGAWFGSINMSVCVVLLALAPVLHWDLWLITLICALVQAWYNFVVMVVTKRVKQHRATAGAGLNFQVGGLLAGWLARCIDTYLRKTQSERNCSRMLWEHLLLEGGAHAHVVVKGASIHVGESGVFRRTRLHVHAHHHHH